MEGKHNHYSKRKKVMFEAKWHFFLLFFCHHLKLDPHFPSSHKACSSLSVLSLGLPPPLSSPLTMICNSPTVHILRLPPSPHFQVLSQSLSFTLPPTHTPLLL
jgi:hypothetical protein